MRHIAQQCTAALGKRKHVLEEEYYNPPRTADPSMGAIFDGPTNKKQRTNTNTTNRFTESPMRETVEAVSSATTHYFFDNPRHTILGKRKHATNESGVEDDEHHHHHQQPNSDTWERDNHPRMAARFKIRKTTEAVSPLLLFKTTDLDDDSTSSSTIQPPQPPMEEARRNVRQQQVESPERLVINHATPRQTRWSEIYEQILIKQLGGSKWMELG